MRKLRFSLYASKKDTHCKPIEATWPTLVRELFTTFEVRGTPEDASASKEVLDNLKDGPAVVLASIPEGKSHKAANVTTIHAVALDIENHSMEEIEAALAPLAEYTYAAYTTFKHGADVSNGFPRLRVIVPFETPIAVRDYPGVWARLNQFVGGINDPATKDLARLHFLPATFDRQVAMSYFNEGRMLPIEELPLSTSPTNSPTTATKSAPDYSDLEVSEAVTRIKRRAKYTSDLDEVLARALKAMLSGDSIADPGARHETMRRVTWWISAKERSLNEEVLNQLLGASVEVMEAEDTSWDGMADVMRLYNDAVLKRAAKALTGAEPYSEDEVRFIANIAQCTPDEVMRRWIIQQGSQYFFLQSNGYYSPPAGKDDARPKAKQVLARAPILFAEPSQNGEHKRSMTELVEEYGWVADRVVADLTIDGTMYDPIENVVREAVAPIRPLTPQYDPEIATWLKILGGEQHEKLLDWLSVFPDLRRLIACLYVKGETGAGKGLLAAGLSRIWTTGAWTPFESIFGTTFNSSIANCPLVVADEHIPVSRRGDDPTAVLRQIIGKTEHELSRKFRSNTTMRGALRVMLTANNEELLRGRATGPDDQAALIKRVIVIEAPTAAAEYLTWLGGFDRLNPQWNLGDGIARHVLHLAMTRDVKGDRFAVAGSETPTHREIFTTRLGQLVREWLIHYCENPKLANAHPQIAKLVRAEGGDLYVNSEAVKLGWAMYLGAQNTREDVTTTSIGRALSVMSKNVGKDRGRTQRMVGESRVWFYRVDPMHLIEFSRVHMVGDERAILKTVRGAA